MIKRISNVPKLLVCFFLLSVLFSSLSIQIAQAMDVDFYSGNDILFYDPDSCTVSNQNGDIATQGNDVAEKVFRFFTSTTFSGFNNKPFNAIQAAGALGNFQQESTMNPSAIEGNGEGHGLAQWSYDRKTTLYSLARQNGKEWNDLGVQLKMITNEINGSYGKNLINAGFDGVTTPKEASYLFQKVYEGAGTPNQANRDSAAQSYYEKFKDIAPSTDAPSTDSSSCSSGKGSGFTDDGFVIYNQFDAQWKDKAFGTSTIGAAGCAPSSMAMIITALTGKSVTPIETTDFANKNNIYTPKGSSWTIAPILAEHWGLHAKNIGADVSAINKVLQDGGLVVTSGRGASPFTQDGHYITIRGVTPNGAWKLGDSNGQEGIANSKKEWDPQRILGIANADNIVAITK